VWLRFNFLFILPEVQTDGATLLTGAVNAFFAAQNDPSPVSTNAVFNLTSWERTNVIIQPSGSSTKGLEQIDKDGNTLGKDVVINCHKKNVVSVQ